MTTLGILIVGGVLLLLFFKIITKPLQWAGKFLLHALCGFVALFVLNFFGSIVGLTLELSWLNAIVAGVFGLPGVAVLLVLTYLL